MFCLLFIVGNFLCEGAKLSEKKDFILDFTKIDEGGVQPFLAHQGEIIKAIMGVMFTGSPFSLSVRGTPKQIDRFAQTIAAEKGYATAFNKHGLNNRATYRSKYKLESAIRKFERDTGIVWPIK